MSGGIQITNDFVFKYIFGSEKHQAARNGFINATLNRTGPAAIQESQVLNPFIFQEFPEDKHVILDVIAKAFNGEILHLEMQVRHQQDYIQRILYYACNLLSQQLQSASPYSDLEPVISISILDWNLKDHPQMHSVFRLLETSSQQELSRHLEFHFIQMKRFIPKKPLDECSFLERWLILFLQGEKPMEDILNELKKDEGLAQAIEALERCKSDPRLRHAALSREMSLRSYYSSIDSAHKQGMEEGRETGIKEGRETGLKEGLERGRNEAQREALIEHLQFLLDLNQKGILPLQEAKAQMESKRSQDHDGLIESFLQKLDES